MEGKRLGCAGLILLLMFLPGCETMEAISGGDLDRKAKPSTYSYGLPDRYRAAEEPYRSK